jgi:ATP-binding cassette subfamily F protein uup
MARPRGVTWILNKGFTAFEPWRDAILEQEASERHKLGRKIAMEEGWLRYGVTARTDAVLREVLGLSPQSSTVVPSHFALDR